jgi:hypothetical protein
MKLRIFFFAVFLAAHSLLVPPTEAAETPYKIRVGFPSLAFSYMPYYVAQEKGFLKKYNIESEYIQITNSIAPQAVVAGNINYFTSASTAISAGIAGLPLVMVINFCDVSPWVLVTHKDINKPQDLIGKTVALSGARTSPYYYFQAFLKKSEIHDKDVGPEVPAAAVRILATHNPKALIETRTQLKAQLCRQLAERQRLSRAFEDRADTSKRLFQALSMLTLQRPGLLAQVLERRVDGENAACVSVRGHEPSFPCARVSAWSGRKSGCLANELWWA